MKKKIFIGSSVEALPLAEAIQENLEHNFYVTVWYQGIFSLSGNTLDDLLTALDEYDYGIFVFQPDDNITLREEEYMTVRDNVIFELGLYFGRLGRQRAFYLIPRNHPNFYIPSDLGGVTPGTYDFVRIKNDPNYQAIVGPFCSKIKKEIQKTNLTITKLGIKDDALFQKFTNEFQNLISSSSKVALFFIHSRSWRENNHNSIVDFLKKKESELIVFLPNFLNSVLMKIISENFADGNVIESLVKDAFRFFYELQKEYRGKVDLRYYDYYPTYSFYKFDTDAILAMYPTTPKKKNVPSFKIVNNTKFWSFFEDDLDGLIEETKKITDKHINAINKK